MRKKLRIEALKVQSFVTEVNPAESKGGELRLTLRGVPTTECFSGMYPTINMDCPLC